MPVLIPAPLSRMPWRVIKRHCSGTPPVYWGEMPTALAMWCRTRLSGLWPNRPNGLMAMWRSGFSPSVATVRMTCNERRDA